MDYLQQLLKDQKVEWKKLGEVCNVQRGRRLTKKDMIEDGEYLVYQNSMIPLGRYNKYNVKGGTTYVICAGSAGEIGYSSEDFWAADDVSYFECPEFVHSKFVYYYLLTQQQRILQQVRRAGVPRLAPDVLRQLPIPLPPLSVQSRIVEILDKFTALEAELELRKKQYQHYREQLLNFSSTPPPHEFNVIWRKLGEVAEIGTGRSNREDEATDGAYPFYVRSKNILRSSTYQFDETAIVIPGEGGIGDIYHYVVGKYALHQRAYRIKLNSEEKIVPKFVYYYMTSAFKRYIISKSVGATATSIRKPMIEGFPIPLPPLSVQSRIVEILDKFDALTNSITEGLPLEIKLRRQQYEYYREQLLDFRH